MTSLADSVMYDDYVDEIRLAERDGRSRSTRSPRWSRRAASRPSTATATRCSSSCSRTSSATPTCAPRASTVYEWYRDMDEWTLAPAVDDALRDRLAALAAITVAVADGLAMQRLADPQFDTDRAFDTWDAILRIVLENIERLPDGGGSDGAE